VVWVPLLSFRLCAYLTVLLQRSLGEKLVGSGVVIFGVEGTSSRPCRLALARPGLGVESERHQRAHSTSSVAPVV
jgi:hypothetical protein